jgi:hypothetical protein
MRIAAMMVGVLWLGCSVQLAGAPCADDLQCPKEQRCAPEAVCVEGPRTAEMLEESCQRAVKVVAERVSECFGGTVENFLKVLGPEPVCQSVKASVEGARQAFHPEEFGACVRNLRQVPCGNLSLEKLSLGTLLEGCTALVPQVAAGQPCGNSSDCQGGWCSTAETCPGVCRAFIPYSGACTEGDQCQVGSTCSGGICRRYVGLGGICSATVQCDPNSGTYCQDGRCVEQKGAGAPCNDTTECKPRSQCVKTQPAQGNNSPKECREVKALGEPCAPGAGECALLSYCDAGTRTCRSWPGPGERCADAEGTGEGSLCLESRCEFFGFPPVCVPYNPAGGGCLTSLDCGPTGACRKFRCTPNWCPPS